MARLDELERKFEENPRRYFAPLANEYRKAGDARRAVDLCRAQLPEIPGHISGHIVLGQALFDAGDYPGSRSALETALSLDPENIVALRYLGDIARDTGDFSEAARWYTRTLEADPYNEAAQAGLDSLQPGDDSADGQHDGVTVEAAEQAHEPPGDEPESLEPHAADAEPLEREVIDSQSHEHLADAVESYVPQAVGLESPELRADELESPEPQPADSDSRAAAVDEASMVDLPQPVDPAQPPEIAEPSADPGDASTEFAGDLDVSAVTESVEPRNEEAALPTIAPDLIEPEPTAEADVATEVVADLLADVEAHREAGLIFTEESLPAEKGVEAEEAIQTEERVLEAAAPFVTETMADLYMEQGYPHEALELMLQLAEHRRGDESLRVKIELIQSAILARRDAAVAAARAERSEASTAYSVDETRPTAGAADVVIPAPSLSVREMFARMDGARPRVSPVSPPKPAPALRSDFVQMPHTQTPGGAGRRSETGDHRTSGVPRSSGPHPTFDPSTADSDDFDAWLRGLRGP